MRYEIHIGGASGGTPQGPQFTEEELTAASTLAGVNVNTLTAPERLAWVQVVRAQRAAGRS